MKIDFKHNPGAHCESGVTVNMLRFYGVAISEPLALGIGAGLFFSYMPFIHLHGMPVFSFRSLPGHIFSRVMKHLGIKVNKRRFLNRGASMQALDKLLEKGIPVGVVVGVFYLTYFPKEYRFHFNAHNLCVIGKEDDVYTVSDPVSLTLNELSAADLLRVRFAKGTYPPMGKMYWVKHPPAVTPNLKKAILNGIKHNCKRMLDIPIPYFGVKGIYLLAKHLRRWEQRLGERKAALCLAQVVRMLEEIGTGGAGFRYMYAAFLQEAAAILNNPAYLRFSDDMTSIGDLWRDFACEAARRFKNRNDQLCTYEQLSEKLTQIADREKNLFSRIRQHIS
ncbi:MAG: BtrH N-terminal domain-containing protein [Bacteroidales bacterium]|jgi:hypothetical protein|nr:BtrH N-terminal domain-containing protein [Bacteroidales bacterium]